MSQEGLRGRAGNEGEGWCWGGGREVKGERLVGKLQGAEVTLGAGDGQVGRLGCKGGDVGKG